MPRPGGAARPDNRVRVLILSHPVDTPSTKYRVLQYLPLFQRDGIEVERADIPSGLF